MQEQQVRPGSRHREGLRQWHRRAACSRAACCCVTQDSLLYSCGPCSYEALRCCDICIAQLAVDGLQAAVWCSSPLGKPRGCRRRARPLRQAAARRSSCTSSWCTCLWGRAPWPAPRPPQLQPPQYPQARQKQLLRSIADLLSDFSKRSVSYGRGDALCRGRRAAAGDGAARSAGRRAGSARAAPSRHRRRSRPPSPVPPLRQASA